jgi:hypothetical protein
MKLERPSLVNGGQRVIGTTVTMPAGWQTRAHSAAIDGGPRTFRSSYVWFITNVVATPLSQGRHCYLLELSWYAETPFVYGIVRGVHEAVR